MPTSASPSFNSRSRPTARAAPAPENPRAAKSSNPILTAGITSLLLITSSGVKGKMLAKRSEDLLQSVFGEVVRFCNDVFTCFSAQRVGTSAHVCRHGGTIGGEHKPAVISITLGPRFYGHAPVRAFLEYSAISTRSGTLQCLGSHDSAPLWTNPSGGKAYARFENQSGSLKKGPAQALEVRMIPNSRSRPPSRTYFPTIKRIVSGLVQGHATHRNDARSHQPACERFPDWDDDVHFSRTAARHSSGRNPQPVAA